MLLQFAFFTLHGAQLNVGVDQDQQLHRGLPGTLRPFHGFPRRNLWPAHLPAR